MPSRNLVTVSTFNIRNTTDRYDERQPLLLRDFNALWEDRADNACVIGLQEVVFDGPPHHQAQFLANSSASNESSSWSCYDARVQIPITVPGTDENFKIDGNSTLCRNCCSSESDILHLNPIRAAQRVVVTLSNGHRIWVVNTHLHHVQDEAGDAERVEQARAILEWCDPDAEREHSISHTILLGDFNCGVGSAPYKGVLLAGFMSAHLEATGAEPESTFPTGLQAPYMDDSAPMTTDYIFHRGDRLNLESARLAADTPDPADHTLYASDHKALVAVFSYESTC